MPEGLESIMDVIGEVEVRIIEGNCVDLHKPWREVMTTKRSGRCGDGEENDFLVFLYLLYITSLWYQHLCLVDLLHFKAVIGQYFRSKCKINPPKSQIAAPTMCSSFLRQHTFIVFAKIKFCRCVWLLLQPQEARSWNLTEKSAVMEILSFLLFLSH